MPDRQFSIRMPPELLERVQREAVEGDRSVGAQIRRILRHRYEEQDERGSNPPKDARPLRGLAGQ